MELVIGICDDSIEQIELLRRYINNHFEQSDISVISSVSPKIFLKKIKEHKPQLVFLDIDMTDLNGIKLAEMIKEEMKDTIIIFITAYEEYALVAFKVRAFQYLVKPVQEETFHKVFEEAVELLDRITGVKHGGVFTVHNKDEIICLNYEDILFFEKYRHKIKVYCKNRYIEFYGSLKKLLKDLDNKTFVKCHQGYIVNKYKIKAYKNNLIVLGKGINIPVSRSHNHKIKKILINRLFNGED